MILMTYGTKIQFQLNYMTTNDFSITHTSYDIINNKGIVIEKEKQETFKSKRYHKIM